MKKSIVILFLLISPFAFAQNVGVGTSTPTEKLDVNGNINVTGTIKANGVAGQSNQVLMTNSSGQLVWQDMTQYKNWIAFDNTLSTASWTVPPAVTKILIEIWGAGGGGTPGGGGGGGGYIRAVMNVAPGNVLSIDVGTGGTGSATSANDGEATTVTLGIAYVRAYGGEGGSVNRPGTGGLGLSNSALIPNYVLAGENGSTTTERYDQYDATTYVRSFFYGRGGNCGNTIATGGAGKFRSVNTATSVQIANYEGLWGVEPGGGGGGAVTGYNGAKGLVIIHY